MNPQEPESTNTPVEPTPPQADGYYDEQNESNEDLDLSFLDEKDKAK
jgi:hypothetical protein